MLQSTRPFDFSLLSPEQPMPDFIRAAHRVRAHDFQFARAADFDTTNDWTVTLTATGTATRGVPGAAIASPCLNLFTTATGDGAVAVNNSKFIQMPTTGLQQLVAYLAFDFTLGGSATLCDQVFGIGSGTPTEVFNPATSAVLSAGAGILLRRTASTNLWELFYKTAAGSLLTLTSKTFTVVANTFHRAGFIFYQDANAASGNALALGRVIPFVTPLNLGLVGDDTAELPDSAFFPSSGGFVLDRVTHADAATTLCGIAVGSAGLTAADRTCSIRRILYVDNWRR